MTTDTKHLLELAGKVLKIFPGPYITKVHPHHNHEKWGGLVEVMYAEDEWNAVFQIIGSPRQPLSECEDFAKLHAALDPETITALCKEHESMKAELEQARNDVVSEREAKHKLEAALRDKDGAMGVLFDRLHKAGVDVSDLIP